MAGVAKTPDTMRGEMTKAFPVATRTAAAVLLVGAAVYRFPADDLRLSYQLLAEVAACGLFAVALYRVNAWVGCFAAAACFSWIFPVYNAGSFLTFRAILIGLVWFYLMATMGDKRTVDWLLNAMCIIAVCHVAMLCLQEFNLDPLFSAADGNSRPVGLMSNRNEVSALLAFCLPAGFVGRRWWVIPVCVMGLLMARTLGGAVAALVAATVFCLYSYRGTHPAKLIPVVIALGAGLFFLLNGQDSLAYRLAAWREGVRLYLESPFIGHGLGHWKAIVGVIPGAGPGRWTVAHNEFIQGAVEMGLILPVLVVGYGVSVLRRISKANIVGAAAIAAVVVNSCVNFPLHIGTTALLALTWLAIFEIQSKGNL